MVPEDRKKAGIVPVMAVCKNITLAALSQVTGAMSSLDDAAEQHCIQQSIQRMKIKTSPPELAIGRLSGGNQQKAIVAREIDKNPELLVAVQPTRGLDVGAIEYIHRQIVAERDKGKAVLLVSLELDEVMNLSDRILVMYEGEIVGELDPKKTTQEELGLYMAGAKRDEVTA